MSKIMELKEGAGPVTMNNSKKTVFAHEKTINVVRFSLNERLVASASQDRTIKVASDD